MLHSIVSPTKHFQPNTAESEGILTFGIEVCLAKCTDDFRNSFQVFSRSGRYRVIN